MVLFLAFGSLFGMLLPIVTTLFAVGTAASVIALLSRVTTVPEVSTWLAMLVGLGVGIDYALFIVTRHRKGILAGEDTRGGRRTGRQHLGPGRHVHAAARSASRCSACSRSA